MPPGSCSRSKTWTSKPSRARKQDAARPAGPAPTMAAFTPRLAAFRAVGVPLLRNAVYPRSAAIRFISRIRTDPSQSMRVQLPMHWWSQRYPVMNGSGFRA